jgi:hypothetical protein
MAARMWDTSSSADMGSRFTPRATTIQTESLEWIKMLDQHYARACAMRLGEGDLF